jgi:hypothetical protein
MFNVANGGNIESHPVRHLFGRLLLLLRRNDPV